MAFRRLQLVLFAKEFYNVFRGNVHFGINIGVGRGKISVVMHQARGVALLYPCGGVLKSLAIHSLIAQRPKYNARMVLVALYHILYPIESRSLPSLADWAVFIGVEFVHFDVGLVYDVHSKLVAQIVKRRMVGIMRCAYGVDIVFFHRKNVRLRNIRSYSLRKLRRMLMAVDSLEQNRFPVDENLAVLFLNAAETNVEYGIDFFCARSFKLYEKLVKVRILGAPRLYILNCRKIPAAEH